MQADVVDDMPLVTPNGPIRLGDPVSRTMLCALKNDLVDGPPDPTISPVRSFDTSPGSSPLSATACAMAMKV